MNFYILADLQLGAHGFDYKAASEYIREAAEDPIGRVIGLGDFGDGISPSNRKLLAVAHREHKVYDTFMDFVRHGADEQTKQICELLFPLVGKVDWMLQGHHNFEYTSKRKDGTHYLRTTDHDIADFLGCRYYGEPGDDMAQVLASYFFPPHKAGAPRAEFRMFAMHGQGGSATFAGPLTSLEKQMRAHNAHLYATAHHHKLLAAAAVKLEGDPEHETKLRATDSRLVSAGSWLKGFLPEETTYAEAAGYVPLALGAPVVHVRRRDDGTFRVRVTV